MNKPLKNFLNRKVSISRLILGTLFFIVAIVLIQLIRFTHRELLPTHKALRPSIPYLEISTTSSQLHLAGMITEWSFKNMHDCALDSGRMDCNDGVNTYTLEISVQDNGRQHTLEKQVTVPEFRREPSTPTSQTESSELLSWQVHTPSQAFYVPARKLVIIADNLESKWPEGYYKPEDIAPLAVEKNIPVNFYYLSWENGQLIERERRRYFPRVAQLDNDTLVKGALLSFDGPETDPYLGLGAGLIKSIELIEGQARSNIETLSRETQPIDYKEAKIKLFRPHIVPDPDADWRQGYGPR